ncbi:jg26084, partial [Pararge aegeria aegeria]
MYVEVEGTLPWERWSWSAPQEPIEYFFRRHEINNNFPIKNPDVVCDCPPNK